MSAGLWCNGNTADSGPAFPGSSPGSPTKEVLQEQGLFLLHIFAVWQFIELFKGIKMVQ